MNDTLPRQASERPNLDGGRPRSCRVAEIEGLIEAVIAMKDDAEAMRLAERAIERADAVERDAARMRVHARQLLRERIERLNKVSVPEVQRAIAESEARS